jgi:hypothetical protein
MSAPGYVRGRVAHVFDTPGAKRPRWTAQDAEAVREVCNLLTEAEREAVALSSVLALAAAYMRDDAPDAIVEKVRSVHGLRLKALAEWERLARAAGELKP